MDDLLSPKRLGFDISQIRNLYPFESKFFQQGSLYQHYIDEGEGDEAVLMLHGNPTWSFYYRRMIKHLHPAMRAISPDHMGCGLSDKPQNWSYRLEDHIQNLLRLIEHLGLKKIHLVVHDWGGMIGFGAALRIPEKICSFMILNTCAFRLPPGAKLSRRIGLVRVPGLGNTAVRVFNGFARGAALMATVSGKMSAEEKAGLLAPYNSYQNRIATLRMVQDIPLNPSHPSYELLKSIEESLPVFESTPKTMVWGRQDFCFNDDFLKRWMDFYPELKPIVVEDAGHYILEDDPETVLQKLDEHLKQVVET